MNDHEKKQLLKEMINQEPNIDYDRFVSFFAQELNFGRLPFIDQPQGYIALRGYGEYLEMVSDQNVLRRSFNCAKFFIKAAMISALKNPSAAPAMLSAFVNTTKDIDRESIIKLIGIIKEGEHARAAKSDMAIKNKYLSVQ